MLLNNDTVVEEHFLNELIEIGNKNKKIGLIGPKIYFYENPNLIQSAGIKINWNRGETLLLGYGNKDRGQYNHITNVDAISGCAMLINKESLLKMNEYLDIAYFLYYEDSDFCVRIKKLGYDIIFAPQSIVWHKSSISSKKVSGTREYYSIRNLFLFMDKYSTKKQFYFFLLYFFCFKVWFTSLIIILYHHEPSAFVSFIKGISSGIKSIRVNK